MAQSLLVYLLKHVAPGKALGVVNLIAVLPVSTVWVVGVALAPSVASAPRRVTSVVALACGPCGVLGVVAVS